MSRRETEVNLSRIRQADTLEEIGQADVEIIPSFQMKDIVELEKFMQDRLTIVVFDDHREGALKIITPQVNGVAQPILRGRRQKVKRKYVEVLAHSVFSKQEQNLENPAHITSAETTTQSYPFVIYEDPSPHGPAWLEHVLAQTKAAA
jgi:hypothetical protein